MTTAGVACLALVAVAPSTSAAAEHSFTGSCAFEATSRFNPGVKATSGESDWGFQGEGRCSGNLDGQELSETPVTSEIAGKIEGSCSGARIAPSPGHVTFTKGTLTTRDDVSIEFVLEGQGTFTETDFTLRGEKSGVATGRATFITTRTSPDTASQCAGEGVSSVPTDATLTTESPLVSETPTDASAKLSSMRVRVVPRAAPAGRRTAFRFRVTGRDGRPIRGARIRFAGKRARTARNGRAKIVARIKRPGRYRARVSRSGFRAATVVVRVRRP